MGIFNSYVSLPEGNQWGLSILDVQKTPTKWLMFA